MPDAADQLYQSVKRAWPEAPQLSEKQIAVLQSHYSLLRKWNPKINVVGPSTLEVAAMKHYAESLFLASLVPAGIETILDAGTGAGFPGFPVAVFHPSVHVTLVESDRRKAAFLRESCSLANVTVLCGRLESVEARPDAVITRAVDPKFVLAWGAMHSLYFGFIGSTADCASLQQHPSFVNAVSSPLPWQPASSALWGTFHVKPA